LQHTQEGAAVIVNHSSVQVLAGLKQIEPYLFAAAKAAGIELNHNNLKYLTPFVDQPIGHPSAMISIEVSYRGKSTNMGLTREMAGDCHSGVNRPDVAQRIDAVVQRLR
jgi:hypothetical protein